MTYLDDELNMATRSRCPNRPAPALCSYDNKRHPVHRCYAAVIPTRASVCSFTIRAPEDADGLPTVYLACIIATCLCFLQEVKDLE